MAPGVLKPKYTAGNSAPTKASDLSA